MILTLQEVLDTCPNWDKFCDLKGYDPYAVNEGGGHVNVNLDLYTAHILGIIKMTEYNIEKYSKECHFCHERVPKYAGFCFHCHGNLLKKTGHTHIYNADQPLQHQD